MYKFLFGIVAATFIGLFSFSPQAEAGLYNPTAYWCDNYNYPRAYAHMGVNYYVDLSSAVVKEKSGNATVMAYNVISVSESGTTHTYLFTTLLRTGKGVQICSWRNNGWEPIADYGYNQPEYNAGLILIDNFL